MRPFAALFEDGYADMVMMAHVVHSDLTEANRPASLSTYAIENVLRGELRYDGIVVADDMQMGAITQSFTPDESILLGIEAGLDIFIYSNRQHPDFSDARTLSPRHQGSYPQQSLATRSNSTKRIQDIETGAVNGL